MSRRKFTREFKVSAVKLVNEQGYSIAEAARSLGVDPGSVRDWVKKFSSEAGLAPSGEGALAAELTLVEVAIRRDELRRILADLPEHVFRLDVLALHHVVDHGVVIDLHQGGIGATGK